MNAIEFVKKYGIYHAIKVLNYDSSISSDFCHLDFGETESLKQIVEAWGLVESWGGIERVKRSFHLDESCSDEKILTIHGRELKKAINLVEQCHESQD